MSRPVGFPCTFSARNQAELLTRLPRTIIYKRRL